MSGGDSGGGSQSSRPLTAAERSELYDAALAKMGGYIPKASNYQGYQIVDPSADRGRGNIYGGATGYRGYSNIDPRTIQDNTSDYYGAQQRGANITNEYVAKYLDDYFAKRQAEQQSNQQSNQYDVSLYGS